MHINLAGNTGCKPAHGSTGILFY